MMFVALAPLALLLSPAAAFVQPSHRGAVGTPFVHSLTYRNAVERSTMFNLFGQQTSVDETQADITKEEVRALFDLWNNALATGDSRIVAARYSPEAVLLATVSDTPRTDLDGIKDYFDTFLKRKPQGQVIEGHIKVGNGWAKDSGIYEFRMGDDNSIVKARYSFLYVKENGKWKILHHHSSVMPEGISISQPISVVQVRNLFNLWNDALATGDSELVANRYAKNAVLLPTVSDTPRTNHELIKDYFDNFLLRKPQGEILESHVKIGVNWAKDSGIYEFTMGADGSKVKGRYSFIYVWEDGQWKISHHHSSIMPESITVAQPITKDEVRSLFGLWNAALKTGDSTTVAHRYSKHAVLLPTVSDKPRTSFELIKDYFDAFLLRNPEGVIESGDITIGTNWAQDAGIYEFTMGDDGSKVRARYSFVYVYEDGEWKISHHHSSVMPEGYLNPKSDEEDDDVDEAKPLEEPKAKTEIKAVEVPVVEEVKAVEEVPVVEEVKAVEVPVVEEVKAVEVPVVEEVKAVEEVPVVEEIKAVEVPVVEEVKAVEEPKVETEVKAVEEPKVETEVKAVEEPKVVTEVKAVEESKSAEESAVLQ